MSDWCDDFGACKACDGEIPHGHMKGCYVRPLQERIAELEAENERLRADLQGAEQRTNNESILELYHDLLYQVETKFPNETRHETAKRLIRNAERGNSEPCGQRAQAEGSDQ